MAGGSQSKEHERGLTMYGKIFLSMYDGTLGTSGLWEALVTFQQLIVLAEKDGCVDMTPEAIARRTTIPFEIIAKGLEALEQPDPHSRTPDEEGRRIVRLSDSRPWGWKIVNYSHYRTIRTADDRREYHRQYAKERRSKKVNKSQPPSTNATMSTKTNEKPPIVEEEVEVKVEGKKNSAISVKPKRPSLLNFNDWWEETTKNPAYEHIDHDRELEKMKAYLTTPRGRGRKLTKNFALSWLNNIDPGEIVKGTGINQAEGQKRVTPANKIIKKFSYHYCNAHREHGCMERYWPLNQEEFVKIQKNGWVCDRHTNFSKKPENS